LTRRRSLPIYVLSIDWRAAMEEDTKHPIGPMEWLDDGSDPGAPPSKRLASPPSSGLSIGSDPGEFPDPPRLITYVTHFRLRCEAFADLALDMIAEGDDDIAYGAARKAAHYGNITHGLYEQRVEELKIAHPEWWSVPVVFVLLALLLGAIPARADVLDGLIVASAAADLYTTEVGLRQPGLREGNPLMQEPAVALVIKAGVTSGTVYAADQLRKHGHRNAAKWVVRGMGALWLGAAGWNMHKARGAK